MTVLSLISNSSQSSKRIILDGESGVLQASGKEAAFSVKLSVQSHTHHDKVVSAWEKSFGFNICLQPV